MTMNQDRICSQSTPSTFPSSPKNWLPNAQLPTTRSSSQTDRAQSISSRPISHSQRLRCTQRRWKRPVCPPSGLPPSPLHLTRTVSAAQLGRRPLLRLRRPLPVRAAAVPRRESRCSSRPPCRAVIARSAVCCRRNRPERSRRRFPCCRIEGRPSPGRADGPASQSWMQNNKEHFEQRTTMNGTDVDLSKILD